MLKNIFVIILVVGVLGSIAVSGFRVYSFFFEAPNDSPVGTYQLEVTEDSTLNSIAADLVEDNVINTDEIFLFEASQRSISFFVLGLYEINVPDTPVNIIEQLEDQSDKKSKLIVVEDTVRITFIEGETVDQMITKLDENGVASRDELERVAASYEEFDTVGYPFLPEPIDCEYGSKDCAKYYIEGYLYPDTYDFLLDMDPVSVYEVFLNNFNSKVWSKISDQVGEKDFHEAVIMASVIEKETGRTRGVTNENREELNMERKLMAGVFYNRLESGMRWGSDVTAVYGTGRKLCQQTFTIPNCVFLDSEIVDNQYNTYRITGYPIGPITSPRFENIDAAINPTDNSYLFFVSDVTGKNYFASTDIEHNQNIIDVSQINRELGIS